MTDESDVRQVLTGVREAKLYRGFHAAWDDVREDQARYPIWPRTRANMMFERLAARLQEAFADDPGVRFSFADETVKIIFDNKVVVRCKKANDRGLGQNVRTFANDLFVEQGLLPLAGVVTQDKVEIVYVLNMYSTEIKQIMVQARDGDVRLWAYEIDDMALAPTAPVTPMPTPTAPVVTDVTNLVQPRSKPISKDETDKGK